MSSNREKTKAFLQAALRGELAQVETFLAARMNVDSTGADGRTALMNASGGAHVAVVDRLLAAGANVKAVSKGARDALEYLLMPDWAGLFIRSKSSDPMRTCASLLRAGALVRATHLSFAAMSQPSNVLVALLKTPSGRELSRAVRVQLVNELRAASHEWTAEPEVVEQNLRLLAK